MPSILPVSGLPSEVFTVALSGKIYKIRIRWVDRTRGWYIAIADSNGLDVTAFEKLTPNQLVVFDNLEIFPDGNLMVISFVNQDLSPMRRDNFGSGKDYELMYVSKEEVAELLRAIS